MYQFTISCIAPPAVVRVANPTYGNSPEAGFGWLHINYEFSTNYIAVYGIGATYKAGHTSFQAAWCRRTPNVDYAAGAMSRDKSSNAVLILNVVSHVGRGSRRNTRIFGFDCKTKTVKNYCFRDITPVGTGELEDVSQYLRQLSTALAEWKSSHTDSEDEDSLHDVQTFDGIYFFFRCF